MPVASGNAMNRPPKSAMRHCTFSGHRNHEPMSTTVPAPTTVDTVSTHFSRWRSSPRAPRSRSARARTPSPSATHVSTQQAPFSASITARAPGTPSGLETGSNGTSNGPGRSTAATTKPSDATADMTATGRQRRDGRRPSGNSSSERAINGAIGSASPPSTAALSPGTSPPRA